MSVGAELLFCRLHVCIGVGESRYVIACQCLHNFMNTLERTFSFSIIYINSVCNPFSSTFFQFVIEHLFMILVLPSLQSRLVWFTHPRYTRASC